MALVRRALRHTPAIAFVALYACNDRAAVERRRPLDPVGPSPSASQGPAPVSLGDGRAAARPEPKACPAVPTPSEVPDGWRELPVLECLLRVYTPGSADHMPSPLAWRDCDPVGPDPQACRELVVEPSTDGQPESVTAYGVAGVGYTEPDGRVVLPIVRSYTDASRNSSAQMSLVAEVDGRVRQALFTPYAAATAPLFGVVGVHAGNSTWSARREAGDAIEFQGFGGEDTLLEPRVLFGPHKDRGVPHTGRRHFAEFTGSIRVSSFTGRDFGVISTGLEPAGLRWAGDTLFWVQSAPERTELWMWTEAKGSFRLHGYAANDLGKSPASLGTDGVDLVWIEGSGRDPSAGVNYPSRAIYTARFTTEPSELEARRLRSWEPAEIWSHYPVVGCGHAAFLQTVQAEPDRPSFELLVVRLADGVSWTLRSPERDPEFRARWSGPVALSCTELFADTQKGLRRIALDSLGPGRAPD